MRYTHILLRTGELFLKGKNRQFFEQRLEENIFKLAGIRVRNIRLRYVCDYLEGHQKLRKVFGLTSYSPCIFTQKDIEKIKGAALEMVRGRKGTFRVEAKRADKSFPISSHELNVLAGSYIEENTGLKFDRDNPNIIIGIEVNQAGAFVFDQIVSCFGGLPTGVEGKVGLLLEDAQSILAGLLFLKRGCSLEILAQKDIDISLLQMFSPLPLRLKRYTHLPEVDRYVHERSIAAIVSGQTFAGYKPYSLKTLVFRPLIAYSKEKIAQELQLYQQVAV